AGFAANRGQGPAAAGRPAAAADCPGLTQRILPPPGALPPAPGPNLPYDPGYLYLPDRDPAPPGPPEQRFLQRWWFDPSLEFAWTSTAPAPQTLKLRPPDVFGRTARLNVPLGGELTRPFQFGLGLSAGHWLGDGHQHAVDGSLFLSGNNRTVGGFAPGTAVLFPDGPARSAPTILRLPGPADAFAMPFAATAETTYVSLDLNYRVGLLVAADWRVDALAGYRFAYLEDQVYLGEMPDSGTTAYAANRFRAVNTFHGGQVGLAASYRAPAWFTDGNVKLAYGGVTTTSTATGAMLDPQLHGAWVGTTTQAAFLPSLNVRVGVRVSDRGRAFVGYTFQYLSHVNRLGDVLGCGCDGPAFWVQSLGLGFELGY
ncbi:MAG: BBP7 family outer membrane beta-barrel protein, partial [Gemmataceae bacterium]|nr:BBP7 family outer membrane beta-barrel protein [Gemmataceae bacterium]